jgi:thiamine-phosphate pyrophosphorylase
LKQEIAGSAKLNKFLAFGGANLFICPMILTDRAYGLYLILTDPVAGYERCAEVAVAAGIRFLQLRMKGASDAELLSMATRLREITRGSATRFIMNDRVDVAQAVDADGVHLGQSDLSLTEARAVWNVPSKLFGLSTHTFAQMESAQDVSPDYIGIGPVFATQTKLDAAAPLGVAETGRIALASGVPHVAIGGINAANLADILEAGVVNFCVVGAVNRSLDPAREIGALMDIWRRKNDC